MKLISKSEEHQNMNAWVEINTSTGNMVIHPGHAPIIIYFALHAITLKLPSGKEETLMITIAAL